MTLNDDLVREVDGILRTSWRTRNGQVVPDASNVALGNDAVLLLGTVLYADLAEPTGLVNVYIPEFAAEVYKAYLRCAAKVIRNNGGVITSYDGDRIMAIFIGNYKNTSAAKAALQINHCVLNIINPAIRTRYPSESYKVSQAVGIDTSKLFVARTGIRGSNDLVWVGRAANYAAKLCSLREDGYASWITAGVYDAMDEPAKFSISGRHPMWEPSGWTGLGLRVYGSSWYWKP